MRKVVLYIAVSLDGFLAKEDGGVDWLEGEDPDSHEDGGYTDFLETIDTIIMGYRTYHQVVTELSPGNWPYEGKEVFVLTHRKEKDEKGIRFVNTDLDGLLTKLTQREGKNIWICGGADVVRQCMERQWIDIYHITVIPRILGKGILLFSGGGKEEKLRLLSVKCPNGMVEMIYGRLNE